jgi:hypothetical protein
MLLKYLYLYISHLKQFKRKPLSECIGYEEDEEVYCTMESSEGDEEFTIYLNTTATELLSKRNVTLKVIVGGYTKRSEEVQLSVVQSMSIVSITDSLIQLVLWSHSV